jgi:hypothetical protein
VAATAITENEREKFKNPLAHDKKNETLIHAIKKNMREKSEIILNIKTCDVNKKK